MIIFFGGLIGAGKSTIARKFAAEIGCLYYDVDEIKKSVAAEEPDYQRNVREGIPFSDETRLKVFDRVIEDLRALRGEHEYIVVDETLHRRGLRRKLYAAAEEMFGDFVVIWVRADEKVITDRLRSTKREGHLLDDPQPMRESFQRQFEEFDRSVIVCNNNGEPEEALAYLKNLIESTSALLKLALRNREGKAG
ncbi:MAG: AAA family ATPase [Rhodobacteraceae bacterium]|nr:AAA family ATPase [Paracoccaceae bacterium]